MRILAVDTSTKFLVIGVLKGNNEIAEYRMELGRALSSYILVTIERILGSLGLKAGDFDYFAVGLGPGSFTGLRIGLSVIKGLAYCLKKPVIGIPSLDILARNAINTRLNKVGIVPLVDAKRNLVYAGGYALDGNRIRRTMPYKLTALDDLFKKIPVHCVFLGDALKLYTEKINAALPGAVLLEEDYWYPWGRQVIELAIERVRSGRINELSSIRPIYLYPKECQVRTLK